jgi:hypothetical protein
MPRWGWVVLAAVVVVVAAGGVAIGLALARGNSGPDEAAIARRVRSDPLNSTTTSTSTTLPPTTTAPPTTVPPTTTRPIVLSNPFVLEAALQNASGQVLGRAASESDVADFVAFYHQQETDIQTGASANVPPAMYTAAVAFLQTRYPQEAQANQIGSSANTLLCTLAGPGHCPTP